jgi:hypothetical protein
MHMSRKRDAIPEHFTSAEEAGEFWDTHSASDYWDELEEEELEFELKKRTFLIEVEGRLYQRAKKKAEAEHLTVEQLINILLAHELAQVEQ